MERKRLHKIQSGGRERETQRERVNPCSFIKKEKEMPQLELNNVPKWAELPTGVATGQIISTASTQSSFKLPQKNIPNTHCIYA